MTVHELAGLVLRRWYIFAGILGLLLLLIPMFGKSPQIYTTTAEVNFHVPVTLPKDRRDVDNTETLIDFAGAVVRKYSAENQNVVLSSPNASVFGNGVRIGCSVSLASFGSQWRVGFNSPTAVVRVADTDPESVASRIHDVADRLSTIGRQLQQESGTDDSAYITTAVDLDSLNVSSFGQTRMGKYKGTVVFLAVGFVAATLTADAMDRWFLRRRTAISREKSALRPRRANVRWVPVEPPGKS